MKVNSSILAKQLAESLDMLDKSGKDNKIEASIWNEFVKDKGGKEISNYINVNTAIKSLVIYLCRQAKAGNKLISELGQEWINNLKSPGQENDNTQKVQNKSKTTKTSSAQKTKSTNKKRTLKKNVDTSYSKLSRDQALKKAKKDSRLEKLSGGSGWSISENSFITDIPYARKYTGAILSFVSSLIGENIVVTSALGTGGTKNKKSPHVLSRNYCTHHNAENPKLDIKTNGNFYKLRKKLIATGLFSRVSVEPDHLDIQIKNEVYLAFERGLKPQNILASAKNNTINQLLA